MHRNAANGDLTDYAFSMNISGGTINAYTSGGDGLDSNGSLTISSGNITVWTANTADNQPLDADGTITGGTVLAAGGSAGIGYAIDASQGYVTYGGMGTDSIVRLTNGSAFTITDASSSTVYRGTALCDANYLFYCTADLAVDSEYTLATGNTTLAAATAQTGTTCATFGGMGGGAPGMTPLDAANGKTPPAMNGGTPPEKPAGSPSGTPPEMPAQNNATFQAEIAAG